MFHDILNENILLTQHITAKLLQIKYNPSLSHFGYNYDTGSAYQYPILKQIWLPYIIEVNTT